MELQTKLTHKVTNIQKVLDYIKQQASIDQQLAKRVLLESKTVEKMWDYIVSEAKKQAVNGSAMIEDATVYNWAIHYFIEDDKVVEVKTKEKEEEQEEEQEEKKVATKVETKPDVEQLSLDI